MNTTMSVTSSDHARRPYTRCGSCACTACVTRRCRLSSGQSLSPSCSTHPVPGLDSPTKATDRQRVDGFLRRSIRSGYCSPDTPTFAEQCATVDGQLFNNICHNQNHVLYSLLPPPQQPYKTTTFDRELTANNYRNILDS